MLRTYLYRYLVPVRYGTGTWYSQYRYSTYRGGGWHVSVAGVRARRRMNVEPVERGVERGERIRVPGEPARAGALYR
jgi:hypothetical protein